MENAAYKVSLEFFEGPLDLLLYLIRREEVDIQNISMTRVTSQYLDYLENFRLLDIDLAAEFIAMAANLMYIKSRTLLPKHELTPDEDDPEDDPRWDLIRQLIEYKKFKEAAEDLSRREIQQEFLFALSPQKKAKAPAEAAPPLAEASVFDLFRAFQKTIARFDDEKGIGDIVDDRYNVSDKIDFLLAKIQPGTSLNLSTLLRGFSTKTEAIVTFLAMLELMKANRLAVIQNHLLGDIEIHGKALS